MTKAEREAFLADLHVGIISVAEEGRGPLTLPIWYSYTPGGDLRIITDKDSRKGRLLQRARRFTLCVQTEAPPYKYVSVEGPITAMRKADVEGDVRPMAHRYLGKEMGDQYIEATRSETESVESVVVCMKPTHWSTVDYGKQYGAISG
jgi:nitroimidazol reductase NimA-like FMN-containing flavoprotein (pyridoxamine 5'-phosphate oxidase superfamily)